MLGDAAAEGASYKKSGVKRQRVVKELGEPKEPIMQEYNQSVLYGYDHHSNKKDAYMGGWAKCMDSRQTY